ncbi:MAG: type III pantothenate kinase [Oxalobacteraceae bacterium]
MLLLVDAGNTRIKWALVDATTQLGRWNTFGSVSHAEVGTLAQAWRGLRWSRALLSNVAGAALRQRLEAALAAATALRPAQIDWFAATLQQGGVRNGYRNPAQLGCDRFAALIGAHALFPQQALIVATCGTATTVDALSPDGVFVGGMILPGLGLMASALAGNTAQLPQVEQVLQQPPSLALPLSPMFADNTDDAIVSGCIAAQAGAIERALAAHAREHAAVQCVLAGGAAAYIAPQLRVAHQIVDNLVLIGLQLVALQAADSDPSC